MSSYQEFKKDVNNVATGFVVFLLLSLAFQITFLVIACVATLLLIGISRIFGGKKPFREHLIKVFVVCFLGGAAAGAVIWWYYDGIIYPYYIKKERPNAAQETQQFMDNYMKNDPGYEGYKRSKEWKPLNYEENRKSFSQ